MTKLLYLENMYQYECLANIMRIVDQDGRKALILDQTIFYPQGGGQPSDTGIIKIRQPEQGNELILNIIDVRHIDDEVYHYCDNLDLGPELLMGFQAMCIIDIGKRTLNSRLHSIGHLLDLALLTLGVERLRPIKGYHYPSGAYVEYEIIDSEFKSADRAYLASSEFINTLEQECNRIISLGSEVHIQIESTEHANNRPNRIVFYGDYGVACGGTHVANLKDIIQMKIRKVKFDKDKVQIKYE